MFFRIICIFMLLFYYTVGQSNDTVSQSHGLIIPPCPLESSCGKPKEGSAICRFDEQANCIRKYASKCHLDVAACHEGKKTYDDYSDIYCQMETFMCQQTSEYEHWTIFFGYEKD